jgi:hypothetical protein
MDQVTLVVDKEGSVPGINFTMIKNYPFVFLHLTRNKEQLLAHNPDPELASAINIKGQVRVHLGSHDDLQNWEFHFIQLARLMALKAEYAGRTSSEGSLNYDEAAPPTFTPQLAYKFCLDSGGTLIPYTNRDAPRLTRDHSGIMLTTEMDDHPFASFPVRIQNEKTGKMNWLFRTSFDFEAITVFVARNLKSDFIHQLAWINWHIISRATYKHDVSASLPSVTWIDRKFDVSKVFQGAPFDQDLAAMVANPPASDSKTYNGILEAGKKRGKFIETASWPHDVPSDFFTM